MHNQNAKFVHELLFINESHARTLKPNFENSIHSLFSGPKGTDLCVKVHMKGKCRLRLKVNICIHSFMNFILFCVIVIKRWKWQSQSKKQQIRIPLNNA